MAERPDARTNVLCLYRYWGYREGVCVSIEDAVMVRVHFVDQVAEAFDEAMRQVASYHGRIGPKPIRWLLTGWLPERDLRSCTAFH